MTQALHHQKGGVTPARITSVLKGARIDMAGVHAHLQFDPQRFYKYFVHLDTKESLEIALQE